ncbi:MAG: BrnA antitoxin family protein [Betaproteobacteria bacterium]|nr:BrnA antitoxin family protein [Betaproteobacteria bacterium]
MSRKDVLTAVRALPEGKDFVWDGRDEDDQPATAQELAAGVEAYRRKRGRPAGTASKEQVAIRFDRDVLAAFRAGGPGWQTRMNDALRDWLKTHSPA